MKQGSLIVSTGPHWHSGARQPDIALAVLLALVPAAVAGIARYGVDAVGVIGLAMGSAMAAEALWQKLVRRPVTIADGSAAASGLMLALLLPANMPAYMVVVASVLGIVVGKQCFGGLGSNPLNPALVGYAILRITAPWAGHLDFDLMLVIYDTGFAKEYPEAVFKALGAAGLAEFRVWDLFLGRQTGGIGSSQIAWLLLGGLFLVARGAIRWQIPVSFLAGAALVSAALNLADADAYAGPLFNLITGNVMMGAFFLATDHASSPVSRWGLVAYGLGCGALTVCFRAWSTYPDGVVFAILVMSIFAPLLDRLRARPLPPPVAVLVGGGTAPAGPAAAEPQEAER
jgi:Na+-translocating ferredoxin:NAD+ oxidoreductase subunit D